MKKLGKMTSVSWFVGPVVPVAPVVLALCPLALLASQPQQVFRSGIAIVELDVAVLDRARRPVRGLTQNDFEVFEDGVRQPVVTFQSIDLDLDGMSAAPAPTVFATSPSVATVSAGRHIYIVMDDANMALDPGIAEIARKVARNILGELRPEDLASVVFTFTGREQDLTSDRALLNESIDSLVPHPAPLSCQLRPSGGCDIDTLIRVSSELRSAPRGRKIVFFVSGGRRLHGPPEDDAQMGRLERSSRPGALRELFRELQEANVVVYGFDPSGLRTFGFTADQARASRPIPAQLNESLRSFAESTGGRAVTDTNHPWEHVRSVFEENTAFYLLGFQSANTTTDGKFRRIKVRVNGQDLDVRTRSGYFAKTN